MREASAKERLSAAMMGGNGKKVLSAPVNAVFCADLGECAVKVADRGIAYCDTTGMAHGRECLLCSSRGWRAALSVRKLWPAQHPRGCRRRRSPLLVGSCA